MGRAHVVGDKFLMLFKRDLKHIFVSPIRDYSAYLHRISEKTKNETRFLWVSGTVFKFITICATISMKLQMNVQRVHFVS